MTNLRILVSLSNAGENNLDKVRMLSECTTRNLRIFSWTDRMHFSKIPKAAILQLLKNGFIALQVSTRPSPHLNPMLEWDCLYGSAVPNGPIVRSLDDLWFNLEHRTKIYRSATSITGPTWTGPGARRTSVVRSRQLTAWALAEPCLTLWSGISSK
jgi:hypothetical protein